MATDEPEVKLTNPYKFKTRTNQEDYIRDELQEFALYSKTLGEFNIAGDGITFNNNGDATITDGEYIVGRIESVTSWYIKSYTTPAPTPSHYYEQYKDG